MRVAWFSPVAPERSGISAYTAEIVPRLAAVHEIDLYADDPVWRAHGGPVAPPEADGFRRVALYGARLRTAHDFVPKRLARPYDVVVYQLGNAPCHDYMWPYVFRYPGLAVLHDGQMHHARARMLLQQNRAHAYRAEFTACHPQAEPAVADWVISGLGDWAAYVWPFVSHVVAASRAVAVHNARVASDLTDILHASGVDTPGPIRTIRMGVPEPSGNRDAGGRRDDTIVFAALGLITPEKRIEQAIRALARIRAVVPGVRLRLVGGTVPHYDAVADAERFGVADLVELTQFVSAAELDRLIRDADVCLCQRWPSSRETSASWLRCLAAGKPTVIDDLMHLVDVPTLDPRTWLLNSTLPGVEPIAVGIDVLDEQHSLELAMRKLALDADLRGRLGRAARRFWADHHQLEHMEADYAQLLEEVRDAPRPGPGDGLPASLASLPHLRADHTGQLRAILAQFAMTEDVCWAVPPGRYNR